MNGRPVSSAHDAQWAETLTVWQALDLSLALRSAASEAERLDGSDPSTVDLTSVNCGDRRLTVGIGRSGDTGEPMVHLSQGPAHPTSGTRAGPREAR